MMDIHHRNHLEQDFLALEITFNWLGSRIWQFALYAAIIAILAQWNMAGGGH